MNIDSLSVYVGPNVHAREAVIRLEVETSEACRWGRTRRATSQQSGPRCPRGLRRCSRMERSPVTGLVAYHHRLGDWVHKGDLVATVIDPLGEETELLAETDGRLFARLPWNP
jgi:hypothetical protein